ncbi:MAG: FkbM family methyltransferase [Alphaproteobacteria bacterium]
MKSFFLKLDDDFSICLPETVEDFSTLIFLERESWFEQEVPFLRRLLQAGMKVVDVGASYGFYSLLAARKGGVVWAFEPAIHSASLLRRSIEKNGFNTSITLFDVALSNRTGEAYLATESDPTCFRLHDSPHGEKIYIDRLDDIAEANQLAGLDFLKIDAEGAELAVLEGAEKTILQYSPLIMLEVRDGAEWQQQGADWLQQRGFLPFRYSPHADVLVPHDGTILDQSLLNLFFAQPQRAARLVARDLLVMPASGTHLAPSRPPEAFASRFPHHISAQDGVESYIHGLDHAALALELQLSPALRFQHIVAARQILQPIETANPAIIFSKALVSFFLGLRQEARVLAYEALALLDQPFQPMPFLPLLDKGQETKEILQLNIMALLLMLDSWNIRHADEAAFTWGQFLHQQGALPAFLQRRLLLQAKIQNQKLTAFGKALSQHNQVLWQDGLSFLGNTTQERRGFLHIGAKNTEWMLAQQPSSYDQIIWVTPHRNFVGTEEITGEIVLADVGDGEIRPPAGSIDLLPQHTAGFFMKKLATSVQVKIECAGKTLPILRGLLASVPQLDQLTLELTNEELPESLYLMQMAGLKVISCSVQPYGVEAVLSKKETIS